MEEYDPHHYGKRLESIMKSIAKSKSISERNKELLVEFKNFSVARGISMGRAARYMYDMKKMAEILWRDFNKAGKQDIIALVSKLETHKFKKGDVEKGYSKATKRDFKITLRKFFQWMKGMDGKEFPEEVSWYSIHLKNSNNKSSEELLTEEEVKRFLKDPYAEHY